MLHLSITRKYVHVATQACRPLALLTCYCLQ